MKITCHCPKELFGRVVDKPGCVIISTVIAIACALFMSGLLAHFQVGALSSVGDIGAFSMMGAALLSFILASTLIYFQIPRLASKQQKEIHQKVDLKREEELAAKDIISEQMADKARFLLKDKEFFVFQNSRGAQEVYIKKGTTDPFSLPFEKRQSHIKSDFAELSLKDLEGRMAAAQSA